MFMSTNIIRSVDCALECNPCCSALRPTLAALDQLHVVGFQWQQWWETLVCLHL